MGSPITTIAVIHATSLHPSPSHSTAPQQTFAQVLRQAVKDTSPATPPAASEPSSKTPAPTSTPAGKPAERTLLNQSSGISGAKLEQVRIDLMQNLNRNPTDTASLNSLLPQILTVQSRTGLLREAMQGVTGRRESLELTNRFGKVETEWNQIERLMNSDQSLSNIELVGLQARLYQVTQHIEVLSKVVDQMNSGVKTILNTNV